MLAERSGVNLPDVEIPILALCIEQRDLHARFSRGGSDATIGHGCFAVAIAVLVNAGRFHVVSSLPRRLRSKHRARRRKGATRENTHCWVRSPVQSRPFTRFRLGDHIRSSLWFVPVACVLAGVAVSFATLWIDDAFDHGLIPQAFTGGPDAALTILSAIATSMVSLAALVLTITMVVVQLAMGQFSPRIVQRILRDKPSQFAIGIFVATFAHAMLAMRDVRVGGDGDSGTVPGLAVVVAFLLVLISIAVLVLYVHHIGRSLRVSALIELVGKDTRKQLDVFYPQPANPHPAPDDVAVVLAPMSGVVCHVDFDRLVARAREAGCSLELVPALGEFTPSGAPLLLVRDGDPSRLAEDVTDHVVLGLERTLEQDVAYGLRMLVDIAERSLADSPFLDPTTAVQAIDRLHDCLRQLARRPFPDGLHRDDEGVVRLTVPVMSWEAYVHLAFDEIRQAGASSPQVARRLRASLDDLRGRAPAERIPVLDEQIALLEEEVRRVVPEAELAFSLMPDRQGIGVRSGEPRAALRETAHGR